MTRLNINDSPPKTAYTKRYDYDGSGNVIFEGFAQSIINPLPGGAVWAIKAYTYTASAVTLVQWALGTSAEKNIWDNRAGLTYK